MPVERQNISTIVIVGIKKPVLDALPALGDPGLRRDDGANAGNCFLDRNPSKN